MNKEKPPVLSDEEIISAIRKEFGNVSVVLTHENDIERKAQRDADVAWFKEHNKPIDATEFIDSIRKKAKAETDAISYAQGVLDGKEKVAREIIAELRGLSSKTSMVFAIEVAEWIVKKEMKLDGKSKYMEVK